MEVIDPIALSGRFTSATAALFPTWRGDLPLPSEFIAAFKVEHPEVCAAWHDAYPRLDAALSAQDPWRGYSYWGPEAARLSAGVGDSWLAGFLLWSIEGFEARFEALGLDPEFRLQFNDSFHRIFDQVGRDPAYARTQRDVFMKDLGIVRGRLIPAVGRLLYPWTGLSARTLVRNPAALPSVFLRCGGRRPYFGLHVHQPMVGYFTPAGWSECHRLAALAFKAFPQVLGLMGASWFYDPAALSFSPHLTYLLDAPLKHRALLIRLGEHENFTRDALAMSMTRRAAVERGDYRPTGYALLWSKKDLRAAVSDGLATSRESIHEREKRQPSDMHTAFGEPLLER